MFCFYRYVLLFEVSYSPLPFNTNLIDVHEKEILRSDFDFQAHHLIAATKYLCEYGLEYPLNNSVVFRYSYDLLLKNTLEEIIDKVKEYLTPGKVLIPLNIDDPVLESIRVDGLETKLSLSTCAGREYKVFKEEVYLSESWSEVDSFVSDGIYELSYPTAISSNMVLARYRLDVVLSTGAVVETTFKVSVPSSS